MAIFTWKTFCRTHNQLNLHYRHQQHHHSLSQSTNFVPFICLSKFSFMPHKKCIAAVYFFGCWIKKEDNDNDDDYGGAFYLMPAAEMAIESTQWGVVYFMLFICKLMYGPEICTYTCVPVYSDNDNICVIQFWKKTPAEKYNNACFYKWNMCK